MQYFFPRPASKGSNSSGHERERGHQSSYNRPSRVGEGGREGHAQTPRAQSAAGLEQQDTVWTEVRKDDAMETSDNERTVTATRTSNHFGYGAQRNEHPKPNPQLSSPHRPVRSGSDSDFQARYKQLQMQNGELERNAWEMKKAYENQIWETEAGWQATSQQLKVAHRDLSEIRAHLNRQSEELLVYKGEIHRAEVQHEITRKLLEEKTTELKGIQMFLNKADSLSGADVVGLVNSLNAEVLQVAAFMADTLEFGILMSQQEEVWSKVERRACRAIGEELTQALQVGAKSLKDKNDFDPTLVQFALQICLTWCCRFISTSWALSEENASLARLYGEIRHKGM